MSGDEPDKLAAYLGAGETWSRDRERSRLFLLRAGWVLAGVMTLVAVAEAIALASLLPLKTAVPYTLMVDRQTGYIQALKPLDRETIAPDHALTRSLIAQYVIAREGFDIASLQDDYRKVGLWSAGEERGRYVASMQASNPISPLVRLPRSAILKVEVRGISSLNAHTAFVRFVTFRTDLADQQREIAPWQAVLTYRFSGGDMSAADRLTNPLGFQVVRYRRDAETVPSAPPEASPTPTMEMPPVRLRQSPAQSGSISTQTAQKP